MYKMNLSGFVLTVGFGTPATNIEIVKFVQKELDKMSGLGGQLLFINGPASLPVAFVLCHKLSHLYGVIAIFDPKLQGYVVSVSHTPQYQVGDLIP